MMCICKSREQWITPNSTQGRELRELGTNEAVYDVLAGKQHTLASFLKSSSTTQGLLCKEQSIEKQSCPPRWFDLNCGKWAVRIKWPVGKLLEVLPPTRIKCINYHTGLSFLVMKFKAKTEKHIFQTGAWVSILQA